MSKNIIKTVSARIDEILAARGAELAANEKALDEAKAAVAEARSRADAATITTDIDGYNTACDDLEKAERAVALYAARLGQLRAKNTVTAAEDARNVAQIRAYQKDLQDQATAEIIALLSQIEEIGKEYYTAQNEANNLICRWHRDVCRQQHPHGAGLTVHPSDLHAKDDDLRGAICQIVTMYFYRKEQGVAQYRGVGSIWTK